MATPHISSRDPESVFELIKQIGSGSYGSVHKARIIKSGKSAAVKMINMEDGDELEDVQNEIRMLESCKHDNIVAYFGAFQRGHTMWIAMEYCGGGSVSDIYNKNCTPLEEDVIAHITFYSLLGLEYLHQSHLVHRDIKGGNILLTEDGCVKLADLGVSAQLTSTLAKRKSFIGTPYWIAPEIIAVEMKMGPDGYTSRCDVWSMGITCIEMAEMQPPMFDLHPMRALYLIPKNPPPKLTDKSRWSKDFREFIKATLVKNPQKRPSAGALTKHSFFKQIRNNPKRLQQLVTGMQGAAPGASQDADKAIYQEDTELDGSSTLVPGQSKLQRVESKVVGRSTPASDLNVDTLSPDDDMGAGAAKQYEDPYDNWQQRDVKPYEALVPRRQAVAAASGPNLAPAPRSTVPDPARSSFVLTNVFAGCPLDVLCASSWHYTPSSGEPLLYIIVGATTGLYVLETSGDKRELVQVSRRPCRWLYVMDDDRMMVSISGSGLVCVHDLNSLLVPPGEEIRFKTTKLVENAQKCAVAVTPVTNYTFLCVAIAHQLLLMQWYAPRKKFMKLKDFQTPFDLPPPMMELLVLPDEPLPVLCVGATRDKQTRSKALAIVNPNFPPEKLAKHMSADLGWVRVRSGREDVFATAVTQVGLDRFMLCFSNVASFVDREGKPCPRPGEPEKIVFDALPQDVVYTRDAVIAFSESRMERRSVHTGKITHQMKDGGETFKVVGKEGNIIIQTRSPGESSSHLYLLLRK